MNGKYMTRWFAMLLAAVLLAVSGSWSVAPAAAGAGTDRLTAGERLEANQYLVSRNGQYVLRMQDDGNLVIYAPGNAPLWATATRTSPAGNVFLGNQGDGNLVVRTAAYPYSPLWASYSSGGFSTLVMQDDGNLVLYRDTGGVSWASNTATPRRADLARQILGNSRISLATTHLSGVNDNATARQNIKDTTDPNTRYLAARSSYGTAPGGRVALDERMLRGTLALANTYTFRVSEIAGASHSSGSSHYAGVAIDFDIINGANVRAGHPALEGFKQRCRDLGAIELYGPGYPGHDTHVHCG